MSDERTPSDEGRGGSGRDGARRHRRSSAKTAPDAFGHALLDWVHGAVAPEILERDDGFTQEGAGPDVYLAEFKDWPVAERRSLRHVRGRVLDVGCGAGRVALELQRRGLEVVGLDSSPLAVEAARRRGVREVWSAPLEELGDALSSFDALVLFGNNFGIFATPSRAHRQLRYLARHTAPGAVIFAESTNPYFGGAPALDRTYYRRNKERLVAPGQVRVRYRYANLTGAWFQWLYVSRRDMRAILHGTGWRLVRTYGSQLGEPYVAVLAKD